jgi:1,2-phenylacetyl-CoA epoxidase catalytic subunit
MVALSHLERDLLTRMLISHAYRERLAAKRFKQALALLPPHELSSYWHKVIKEEEEHYQGCLGVGRDLRIDIEPLVSARMKQSPAGIPPFTNWLDALLAHAFNDRAGYFVLLGLTGSKIESYAALATRIVAEEANHGAKGVMALVDYWPSSDERLRRMALITHLDAAVRCLGRPDTIRDKQALKTKLKTQSSRTVIEAFCRFADDVLRAIECVDLTPTSARYL